MGRRPSPVNPVALPLAIAALAGCATTPEPDQRLDLFEIRWCSQPRVHIITQRDGNGPLIVNTERGLMYDPDAKQIAPAPPELTQFLNTHPAHTITIPCAQPT